MNTKLLEQSTRVALVALQHDLGKLAERAGIDAGGRLEAHRTLYCPWHQEGGNPRHGYHSHLHAAYTALAWDALEASGHFPDLRRDCAPFAEAGADDATDSAVNAAAAHHRPQTLLQWIVATADRVASGFERKEFEAADEGADGRAPHRPNHYRARQCSLLEQVHRPAPARAGELQWRHALRPLTPAAVFPAPVATCEPRDDAVARAEYAALWSALLTGLRRIPPAHRANLPLWLDHFDSLWLVVSHAIPSATAFGVKPEVSLYDHSKTTAALATALWRWQHENGQCDIGALRAGWDEDKFMLLQGEFFGIQDFIFAAGGETEKHAHKLLRGRSFQVSLLAECAALKLLDALDLPSTSQITNAAGKFLIVAPNTTGAHAAVARCRRSLDAWCLQQTYGQISVGLAATPASCRDFSGGRFVDLSERLFAALDTAKHRRFALCADDAPVCFADFLASFADDLGVCKINGRHPAARAPTDRRGYPLSMLADDQIRIGEGLTRHARLLVAGDSAALPLAVHHFLGLDYFGYRLAIVPPAEDSGGYDRLVERGTLRRIWDFDAADADGTLWRGTARRFVNSYVPRFTAADVASADKYARAADEPCRPDEMKTLQDLAHEDRRPTNDGGWRGEIALLTVKGDIDDLGDLFRRGLQQPTFATLASLSRQINAFFALWLPWYCEHGVDARPPARYRNTYTVFAGGDDFFLIGPWESTLALAGALREKFAACVVNPRLSFSAGLVMTHPKTPVRQLAHSAESALRKAKAQTGKNAVTFWQRSLAWPAWHELMAQRLTALEDLIEQAGQQGAAFSSGLSYALLELAERSESTRPEDAIWHAQLHYLLARYLRDRVRGDDDARARRQALLRQAIALIGDALRRHRGAYRLPLSVLLYRRRE